eukprot:UN15848
MAAGVLEKKLDHEEVVEMGKKRAGQFVSILNHFFTNFFKSLREKS